MAAKTILSLKTVEVEEMAVDGTDSKIGRVWMNRPEARNSLTTQIMSDLEEAFTFLQKQYGIQAVILGGRGKSFSAGADLKSAPMQLPSSHEAKRKITGRERRHTIALGRRVINAIESLEAVTIARVHGHAAGGGFGLMHACDMKICMKNARLWLPEVDLSVPLTWGLTARLVRDVGRSKAMELIAFCDDLPPQEGVNLGLINKLVDTEEELEKTCMEWATRLAKKNETAVHLMKTHFRALNKNIDYGDVTETDNDFLLYSPQLNRDAKL